MDTQIKAILTELGDALLPLNKWIEERKKDPNIGFHYEPPNKDAPWRKAGEDLSMSKLGVIEFLEDLLRDAESASPLVNLWNARRRDPLAVSPHTDPKGWREARGLAPEPQFGIFDARNNWPGTGVMFDADGNGLSRKAFYARYFPLLKGSLSQYIGQPKDTWVHVASDLAFDSFGGWPSSDMKSSDLIRALRVDLLFALMGMTNPHAQPEYRDALLVELGEHRRRGDAHTRDTIKKARDHFAGRIKPKEKKL